MTARLDTASDDSIETPKESLYLADLRARADEADATFRDRMSAADAHISFGHIDYAKALLETLIHTPPRGQFELLRLCRRIERGQALLVPSDPARTGAMVAPQDDARRIVVAFSPRGSRYLGIREHSLLLRSEASLVFLRDASPFWYMNGIRGLGRDYDDCLKAILRIVAAMAPAGRSLPIYCIGYSSGAYAALRFGLDLEARAVLFFSGPTQPRDTPRQIGDGSRAEGDLRLLYARAPRPPKLTICFGELNLADTQAALRMADLPGVTLVPVPGFSGHWTPLETFLSGQFATLFEATLGV
jgi:hypothetical protein